MAEYFGVARPTHPRPLHNAISTTKRGQRLPGGRQAQPGVATGNNVLAWRLGYAEVLVSRFHLRSNSELSSVKLIQTKKIFGNVIMKLAKISGLTGAAFSLCLFVHSVFHSFRISKGFAFFDSLFPELIGTFNSSIIFFMPAAVLLFRSAFSPVLEKASTVYPIVMAPTVLNVFLADDPLAAGLPAVLLTMPFCIIFSIIYLCFAAPKN